MYLKKSIISAALLAAGLGAPLAAGAAQDYRLAYSKAENMEIFVEGATQENWCASTLKLRAVHGGAVDGAALGRLLPKLGALFSQQCPQAAVADWRELDASGKQLNQGTSRAADGWQLAAMPAPPAVPAEIKPEPRPEPPSHPGPEATSAPERAPVASGAQVPPSPVESTNVQPPSEAARIGRSIGEAFGSSAREAGKAVDQAAAEVAQAAVAAEQFATEAGQAAVDAAQQARQAAAQAGAAMREGFQSGYRTEVASEPGTAAPAAAQTDAGAAEPAAEAQGPRGLADFAVGGWQPPSAEKRAELASFMKTMEDQNGCKIVSSFDFGDQAAYVSLRSEGLGCGADGYAQGKGQLRLERSDGMLIARSRELWFSHGLPFNKPVLGVSPADVVAAQDRNTVWFGLDSDEAGQSHYLLRAVLGQLGGGMGIWQVVPQVDVLTAKAETFRQAADIRGAVDRALSAVQQTAMPNASDVRLLFVDGGEALWARDVDKQLYALNASRAYNYRTGKAQGDWRYNLQHAQNHLFQREQRLAQQQRMEEQRKERERQDELRQQARAEQDKLRQYQELKQLVEQGSTDALRKRMERDIAYRPFGRDAYSRLMAGGQDTVTRIVRVDGSKGDDATVDWPYPMRLLGQKSLKKGWYWISGERRLDAQQLDEDGLPMSLVTPQADSIRACEKSGCADLLDPLAIMRMRLNQPDWSPETAQALIDSAPKGLVW